MRVIKFTVGDMTDVLQNDKKDIFFEYDIEGELTKLLSLTGVQGNHSRPIDYLSHFPQVQTLADGKIVILHGDQFDRSNVKFLGKWAVSAENSIVWAALHVWKGIENILGRDLSALITECPVLPSDEKNYKGDIKYYAESAHKFVKKYYPDAQFIFAGHTHTPFIKTYNDRDMKRHYINTGTCQNKHTMFGWVIIDGIAYVGTSDWHCGGKGMTKEHFDNLVRVFNNVEAIFSVSEYKNKGIGLFADGKILA